MSRFLDTILCRIRFHNWIVIGGKDAKIFGEKHLFRICVDCGLRRRIPRRMYQ